MMAPWGSQENELITHMECHRKPASHVRNTEGEWLVRSLSQSSHQGNWVCDARPDGVCKASGTRPVLSPEGTNRSPQGRSTAPRTTASWGSSRFGFSLSLGVKSLSLLLWQPCLPWASARRKHLLRQMLPEATSKKRGPTQSARNRGGADGAGGRTLRMTAPTHTQKRACAVGPVADRGARWESVWRPSAKLSYPRTCCAWRCGDAREAGRAVGIPSLSDLAGA